MEKSLLNINNYHYPKGGADVVYLEQGRGLERRGWRVASFSMSHEKNIPSQWSKYFVGEIELGVRYRPLELISNAVKVIYSREARQNISDLLDNFSASIAHIHAVYHHISPSVIFELHKRGIPIVLTAHDLKLLCPAYRMHDGRSVCEKCKPNAVFECMSNRCIHGSLTLSALVALEAAVHRALRTYESRIAKVVCPSQFYAKKFLEWGWPAHKLIYIPNACEVSPLPMPVAPGNYICYFGRLSFEKGLITLVRAASLSGVAVKIVGDGPQAEELKALASDLNAPVEFTGRLEGDELIDAVLKSRACVLPSEWYENAPKSVLEAFGLGRIVIGADIGGIPELVEDGVTGFLYKSGDAQQLSQVMLDVKLLSANQLEGMGRACLNRIAEGFSEADYLDRVESMYADILSSPMPSGGGKGKAI